MFGSAYFAGFLVFSLLTSRVADVYGRKVPYMINLYAILLCTLTLIWTSSYYVAVACLFVHGGCTPGLIVGYFFTIEFMPFASQILFGVITNVVYPLIIVIASLYFEFISSDWRTL